MTRARTNFSEAATLVGAFLTISIILLVVMTSVASAQLLPFMFPPTRGVGGGYRPSQPSPLASSGSSFGSVPSPYSGGIFNPMISPYAGSPFVSRPMRFRARPASPARECRKRGACRELEHGTTLASTWQSSTAQTTTTMAPMTTL